MEKKTIYYVAKSSMGTERENKVRKYAEKKELTNLEFITYNGSYSRRTVKKIIKNKKCGNIIVPDITRLGRNSKKVLQFLRLAKKYKVNIWIMDIDRVFRHIASLPSRKALTFDIVKDLFHKKEMNYLHERTKKGLEAERLANKIALENI